MMASLVPDSARPRVAIIGSGISGLGAARALGERVELELFEASPLLGGHSRTESVSGREGEARVDTGFMVYNEVTYPRLTRLFAELGVETTPTDMSFSVQHRPDRLTYQGGGFGGVFAQRRNLLRPRFWRMIGAIRRFYTDAVAALDDPSFAEATLGEFARAQGYPLEFLRWYLLPMAGAVWSGPAERMEQFPARTLLRFWFNHGFLGPQTRHPWRTVVGGSSEYVRRLVAAIGPERVHPASPVTRIEREAGERQADSGRGRSGVTLHFAAESGRPPQRFDWLILAAHAPDSLQLLEAPTELEREIVGAFAYRSNQIQLHCDGSVLPRPRRAIASWNHRIDPTPDGGERGSTHYSMNFLQPGHIPGERERRGRPRASPAQEIVVSVNGGALIDPALEVLRFETGHPQFDLPAIRAQDRLEELHRAASASRTLFAGAWQKYGFHEDGLASGQRAAAALLELLAAAAVDPATRLAP